MNRVLCIAAIALVLCADAGVAQTGGAPAERRALREYTSPQELVSIAPSTTMDKAMTAISEVSQKFVGKVIIDPERRNMPINVDIKGLMWRDALETILRKNGLWYTEYETYMQLTGTPGAETGGAERVKVGGGGTGEAGQILKEAATFRSREIKFSGVFFEVSLSRMEEVGINWSAMKTGSPQVNAEFLGADKVTDKMFKTEFIPSVSFGSMQFLVQLFSNYNLGEVLSGPTLVVRSGEEGRIQVGQDFSIRERDFAGNLIDRFYSTGVILKVTPQVITEQGVNFIHIAANVERSSVQPGLTTMFVNKTVATTNLLLLDGEETIIGGLYSNETTTVRQGVPFLKDLPWYIFGLRYLFGYDQDKLEKKEFVILLKAELVPTLQERITTRTRDDELMSKWREDWNRKDLLLRSGRLSPTK